METLVGYLKFFGVIVGILLLGIIFKWLGLSHIFDLIFEVFLRAMILLAIAVLALALSGSFEFNWGDKSRSAEWFRGIVLVVALLGAAVSMTFFHSCLP